MVTLVKRAGDGGYYREYCSGFSSLRKRMQLPALAQPPRLWVADPHGERRVTWMELFFDLIFVAAVAQVGAPLAKDYSWAGLLRYVNSCNLGKPARYFVQYGGASGRSLA